MSHADYLKGFGAGQNNPGWSPKPWQPSPQTETKVVTKTVVQQDYTSAMAMAVVLEDEREAHRRTTAHLSAEGMIVGTLKKALHAVAPDHPLVNPLRTFNNPITSELYKKAEKHFLETGKELHDEEYETLARSMGEPPWEETPEGKAELEASAAADAEYDREMDALREKREASEAKGRAYLQEQIDANKGFFNRTLSTEEDEARMKADAEESARKVEEAMKNRKNGGGFLKRLISGG